MYKIQFILKTKSIIYVKVIIIVYPLLNHYLIVDKKSKLKGMFRGIW